MTRRWARPALEGRRGGGLDGGWRLAGRRRLTRPQRLRGAGADGVHRVGRGQLPQLPGQSGPILGKTVSVGERSGGAGGVAALTVHLPQMQPGGGPGRGQRQRVDQQALRFFQPTQPQIGQAELTGGFRVGGIGDERLSQRGQRFLRLVAIQGVQSLLEQRLGLGRVAGFWSGQIVELLAKGLHAGFVVDGRLGDHLLDVVIEGFVLAGVGG